MKHGDFRSYLKLLEGIWDDSMIQNMIWNHDELHLHIISPPPQNSQFVMVCYGIPPDSSHHKRHTKSKLMLNGFDDCPRDVDFS